MTGPRLTVELVPSTSWGDNLRSVLTPREWSRLSLHVRQAAGMRCEICGGRGERRPVECHEVWEYDDERHIQRLVRLIALCPPCHAVKHIGRTQSIGRGREAKEHLQRVNGWSATEAAEHVTQAYDRHRRRSQHRWTLDLSALHRLDALRLKMPT